MFIRWKNRTWTMDFSTIDNEIAECILAMDDQFTATREGLQE